MLEGMAQEERDLTRLLAELGPLFERAGMMAGAGESGNLTPNMAVALISEIDQFTAQFRSLRGMGLLSVRHAAGALVDDLNVFRNLLAEALEGHVTLATLAALRRMDAEGDAQRLRIAAANHPSLSGIIKI